MLNTSVNIFYKYRKQLNDQRKLKFESHSDLVLFLKLKKTWKKICCQFKLSTPSQFHSESIFKSLTKPSNVRIFQQLLDSFTQFLWKFWIKLPTTVIKADQAILQALRNSFKQLNRVSVPHFILRKTSNLKWNRTKYNFLFYSSTWYLFLIHIPYTAISSILLILIFA